MMNYQFKNHELVVSLGHYPSGRRIIRLVDAEDGLTYSVPTANLPDLDVKYHQEVLIKDYSENEGMFDFLVSNNIVTFTGKTVVSGYIELYICTLNPQEQWVGSKKLFNYVV